METSIVTVKGQIVIPSKIRRKLGIKKGTRVCFIPSEDELIIRPMTREYFEKMAGILDGRGKALKALKEEKAREREL